MTNAITAYVDRIVSGLTFHGEKPNQAVEGDCYFSNADDGFMIFEQGAMLRCLLIQKVKRKDIVR